MSSLTQNRLALVMALFVIMVYPMDILTKITIVSFGRVFYCLRVAIEAEEN